MAGKVRRPTSEDAADKTEPSLSRGTKGGKSLILTKVAGENVGFKKEIPTMKATLEFLNITSRNRLTSLLKSGNPWKEWRIERAPTLKVSDDDGDDGDDDDDVDVDDFRTNDPDDDDDDGAGDRRSLATPLNLKHRIALLSVETDTDVREPLRIKTFMYVRNALDFLGIPNKANLFRKHIVTKNPLFGWRIKRTEQLFVCMHGCGALFEAEAAQKLHGINEDDCPAQYSNDAHRTPAASGGWNSNAAKRQRVETAATAAARPATPERHGCASCSGWFATVVDLQQHTLNCRQANDDLDVDACMVCSKTFGTSKALSAHETVCGNSKESGKSELPEPAVHVKPSPRQDKEQWNHVAADAVDEAVGTVQPSLAALASSSFVALLQAAAVMPADDTAREDNACNHDAAVVATGDDGLDEVADEEPLAPLRARRGGRPVLLRPGPSNTREEKRFNTVAGARSFLQISINMFYSQIRSGAPIKGWFIIDEGKKVEEKQFSQRQVEEEYGTAGNRHRKQNNAEMRDACSIPTSAEDAIAKEREAELLGHLLKAPGWKPVVDPHTSYTYFWHPATNMTSWDVPDDFKKKVNRALQESKTPIPSQNPAPAHQAAAQVLAVAEVEGGGSFNSRSDSSNVRRTEETPGAARDHGFMLRKCLVHDCQNKERGKKHLCHMHLNEHLRAVYARRQLRQSTSELSLSDAAMALAWARSAEQAVLDLVTECIEIVADDLNASSNALLALAEAIAPAAPHFVAATATHGAKDAVDGGMHGRGISDSSSTESSASSSLSISGGARSGGGPAKVKTTKASDGTSVRWPFLRESAGSSLASRAAGGILAVGSGDESEDSDGWVPCRLPLFQVESVQHVRAARHFPFIPLRKHEIAAAALLSKKRTARMGSSSSSSSSITGYTSIGNADSTSRSDTTTTIIRNHGQKRKAAAMDLDLRFLPAANRTSPNAASMLPVITQTPSPVKSPPVAFVLERPREKAEEVKASGQLDGITPAVRTKIDTILDTENRHVFSESEVLSIGTEIDKVKERKQQGAQFTSPIASEEKGVHGNSDYENEARVQPKTIVIKVSKKVSMKAQSAAKAAPKYSTTTTSAAMTTTYANSAAKRERSSSSSSSSSAKAGSSAKKKRACSNVYPVSYPTPSQVIDPKTGRNLFVCPFGGCPHACLRGPDFKKHYRVHMNIRPYECRHGCGKSFKDTSTRCKHERTHENLVSYACEFCLMEGAAKHRVYTRKDNLKQHQTLAHPDKVALNLPISYREVADKSPFTSVTSPVRKAAKPKGIQNASRKRTKRMISARIDVKDAAAGVVVLEEKDDKVIEDREDENDEGTSKRPLLFPYASPLPQAGVTPMAVPSTLMTPPATV